MCEWGAVWTLTLAPAALEVVSSSWLQPRQMWFLAMTHVQWWQRCDVYPSLTCWREAQAAFMWDYRWPLNICVDMWFIGSHVTHQFPLLEPTRPVCCLPLRASALLVLHPLMSAPLPGPDLRRRPGTKNCSSPQEARRAALDPWVWGCFRWWVLEPWSNHQTCSTTVMATPLVPTLYNNNPKDVAFDLKTTNKRAHSCLFPFADLCDLSPS